MLEFNPFPKMPRLSREVIITEKLDGTNAQILILPTAEYSQQYDLHASHIGDEWMIFAGSRNRFVTPKEDNYGFAGWVQRNAEELIKLGPGQHFGEWWGNGIQRNYGLKEKRFSLFNASRWGGFERFNAVPPDASTPGVVDLVTGIPGPACCHVVPILWRGEFGSYPCCQALEWLHERGSVAAPGFMQPEGIVVYHTAAKMCFKKTILDDASPKNLI